MTLSLVRGALGAAALLCWSVQAFAHATLAVTEASPNSSYRGAIRVGHGCAGSPTVSVSVQIPQGVINAKPMPKPGWTLKTTRGAYDRTYDYFGTPMAEGVREITWSGAVLPDDQYDEFVFVGRVTDAFRPGASVPFPIVQTCESGAHNWTELPGPGQSARDLKSPAPAVRIVQAAATTAMPAAAPAITLGALRIEAPWLRATPGGAKVAGGYLRVTNTGTEPDRLVSASSPVAARGEMHEMSNENGVMKMREVEGGIAVAPGATVELKPGGFHLMLMDLRAPLKEGESAAVTLVFEKAGRVEVTFPVAGMGARNAPAGHHH